MMFVNESEAVIVICKDRGRVSGRGPLKQEGRVKWMDERQIRTFKLPLVEFRKIFGIVVVI